MKLNKLIFPLMIALTATLAVTGCKKGPTRMTQLYGRGQGGIGDGSGQPPTLNPGPQFPGTEPGPGTKDIPPGGGPTADWDPFMYNQDRSALAANTVHFKFDSAAVLDNEQSNISAVAAALSNQNLKLIIEGNCDERGTEEYNRSLGERRALALREALTKAGIDPLRIRTESFGKDKPVDPGHDEAAFAKNRRGDFVLCTPK